MITLPSLAPHDFWLTLDVLDYFEAEYDPEIIDAQGFVKPLTLSTRDVLTISEFNGDVQAPAFTVSFPDQDLTLAELEEVRAQLSRVFGAGIDTQAYLDKIKGDEVLEPLAMEHYGFKRLARASFYEDTIRRVVHSRISHGPTKKRMLKDVRAGWGSAWQWEGVDYWAYPRPEVLAQVDPKDLRELGISTRKGEYITGLARLITDGELSLQELEQCSPQRFLELASGVRGIGPSIAQLLLLQRDRPDAIFPPREVKGQEKGMRKWIFPKFGLDPDTATAEQAAGVLARMEGFEALASSYFYYDWVSTQLARAFESKG